MMMMNTTTTIPPLNHLTTWQERCHGHYRLAPITKEMEAINAELKHHNLDDASPEVQSLLNRYTALATQRRNIARQLNLLPASS